MDVVYDALFRQLGIIRALQFSDLLDIPLALSSGRRLKGRRVAIVTSTGGAASLVADAAGLAGFETPAPDPATAGRLNALRISDAVLDRNPIDVTLAGVKSEYFRDVLDAVLESPSYDAVAVILGSSSITEPETCRAPLRDSFARTDKPIVVFASPHAPHAVRHLNLAGIPTFAAPEACAAAFSAMWRIHRKASPANPVIRPCPWLSGPTSGACCVPVLSMSMRARRYLRNSAFRSPVRSVPPRPRKLRLTWQVSRATSSSRLFHARCFTNPMSGGVAVNISSSDVAATCTRMAEIFSLATNRKPEG